MSRLESADIRWLERQMLDGHCGEGTLERKERQVHNDRIERLLKTAKEPVPSHLGNTPTKDVLETAADMLKEMGERLNLVDTPVVADKLRNLVEIVYGRP